jgi:hypothetical protein
MHYVKCAPNRLRILSDARKSYEKVMKSYEKVMKSYEKVMKSYEKLQILQRMLGKTYKRPGASLT